MIKKIPLLVLFLFLAVPSTAFAQEENSKDSIVDPRYREDQFYASVTYNLIGSAPTGVSLNGVSGGISFGFLRDMPINEQRNVAIAIGGGVSFDQFGQNLFIGEDENEKTIFRALDENVVNFDTNRFSVATVELPLEFRWRTSTQNNFKFWRIYGGLRAGYAYWYRAYFKQPGNEVSQTDIPEFQRFRLGATLSFGYGTFNFYAYYSINPFFKDATTIDTSEEVNMRTLKLGINFYIL